MSIRQKIIDNFGLEVLEKPFGSMVHLPESEKEFLSVLNKINIKPKTMVEIGTCSGISSVYFAQWAFHVTTFDIREVDVKYKIWESFNATNIFAYVLENSPEIAEILKNNKFDFAFIDGAHDYKSVIRDIEMVKKCGRILFHDFYYPEVRKAIKKLIKEEGGGLKVKTRNFAYWERV